MDDEALDVMLLKSVPPILTNTPDLEATLLKVARGPRRPQSGWRALDLGEGIRRERALRDIRWAAGRFLVESKNRRVPVFL